jgi:hypothetical protein
MPKKNIMRLTVPGKSGYVPNVDGNDLVRDGGKVVDSSDVTDWLLTKLADMHSRARQIISDHLANLSGSGNS